MASDGLWRRVFILLIGVSVIALGLIPWWRLVGQSEPAVSVAFRLVSAVIGFVVVIGSFWKGRSAILISAGLWLALSGPLLIGVLTQIDSKSASLAVLETLDARRVLNDLNKQNPVNYAPYIRGRQVVTASLLIDDYSVVDAAEDVASFTRLPMFLTPLLGLLLLFASATLEGKVGLRALTGRWGVMVVLLVAYILALSIRPIYAKFCLHEANIKSAQGLYRDAVALIKSAIRADPRLEYSYRVHLLLGQIYGRMKDYSAGDYLASIADIYILRDDSFINYNRMEIGVNMYAHQILPTNDPYLQMRAGQAFVNLAVAELNQGDGGRARVLLNMAKPYYPHDLEVPFLEAVADVSTGDYREAARNYIDVIKLNEDCGMDRYKFYGEVQYAKTISAGAWMGLAWCYWNLGDLQASDLCRYNATLQTSPSTANLPSLEASL